MKKQLMSKEDHFLKNSKKAWLLGSKIPKFQATRLLDSTVSIDLNAVDALAFEPHTFFVFVL